MSLQDAHVNGKRIAHMIANVIANGPAGSALRRPRVRREASKRARALRIVDRAVVTTRKLCREG